MSVAEVIDVVLLSLRVGLVSTLLILVPGVAVGYLLARGHFRGKTVLRVLVTLPMVLPPVAVGLLLLVLFSQRFAVGSFLGNVFGGTVLFTWWAAVIASAVMSFPLLVLGAESGFRGVPRRLEQVAATLGAAPGRVFLEVSLPLARRGILHGAAFAFVRGLGEYGATALVAGDAPGRTRTLALAIFERIESFQDRDALVLSAIAIALALVTVGAAELFFGGRER
ncbi:MAG TPA: molybdate ABC transporter permease subunit [Planctomycetes bacterium]|nr:molybdate ABC transporter permease subunit [Planctomycetota bacterium]